MNMIAVDDEEITLALLIEEIQNTEPEAVVQGFQFPATALAYATSHPVDIAFLDIEMPQMSGLALAKKLKALNPSVNIIFVTAYHEYGVDAMQLHASGYLLKPVTATAIRAELDALRFPITSEAAGIQAVTFGQFDLLVNGNPVHFSRSKSKELLAYLIDRHGNGITKKEIAAILFEDQEYDRKTQDYINKIIKSLDLSLHEAGAGSILIKRRNHYAIDPLQFRCDLYEYENGVPSAINAFHGEYMTQYSWGELSMGNFFA